MKLCTRLVSLLAAITMLIPALVSCGDLPDEEKTSADGTGENEYVEENGYRLPVNNYNGATCTICRYDTPDDYLSGETGDSLNDAAYRMNEKIEDLYNVDIVYPEYTVVIDYSTNYHNWVDFVRKTFAAGDQTYQVVTAGNHWMAAEVMNTDYYQNLLDLPYLDFSQPWWNGTYQERANLGGALYLTVGSLDTTYYDNTCAILFNKEMAEEVQIGNLYDLVNSGGWTLDKLEEYTRRAALDLDGNGVMEQDTDRFGLLMYRNGPLDAFVSAFNVRFTENDSNGLPVLLDLSEHYVDIQEELNRFVVKDDAVLYAEEDNLPVFLEGRALFEGNNMARAVEYRAMENDFGILPYPKWDENQENYCTHNAVGGVRAYLIPITTDGDMPANILEAMAYFGYKMLAPVCYDKILKGRMVRDEESSEMLDLLFSTIDYHFVQIYSHFFDPSPDLLLRTTLYNHKSLTTEWAKRKRMYATKMEQLIEKLP